MVASHPVTRTMKLSEVQGQLDTLVTRVRHKETRVIVEQGGVAVAAIVSTDDLARLDRLDAEREADFAVIDELRAAFASVPDEELEREADRALAEVRAEMRIERAQAAATR